MNENQKLGTIMKELIRFSLPLILSGVLQQLYNWQTPSSSAMWTESSPFPPSA